MNDMASAGGLRMTLEQLCKALAAQHLLDRAIPRGEWLHRPTEAMRLNADENYEMAKREFDLLWRAIWYRANGEPWPRNFDDAGLE